MNTSESSPSARGPPKGTRTLPDSHPPATVAGFRRYQLSTSEALEGVKRVMIREDGGRVVWEKTRELTEDEIVDTVFDSAHHPRWTIRRPIVGWYFLLQQVGSPDYIELSPAAVAKGEERDGSLAFSLPSGPIPPSPVSPSEKDNVTLDIDSPSSAIAPTPSAFRLQPRLLPLTHPHSHASSHHHSRFSLSGLKALVAGRGTSFCCVSEAAHGGVGGEIIRFEEAQSLLSSTSTHGTLSLSPSLIDDSGMEPSFWASLGLGYLEFLEEKEGWLAAQHGD